MIQSKTHKACSREPHPPLPHLFHFPETNKTELVKHTHTVCQESCKSRVMLVSVIFQGYDHISWFRTKSCTGEKQEQLCRLRGTFSVLTLMHIEGFWPPSALAHASAAQPPTTTTRNRGEPVASGGGKCCRLTKSSGGTRSHTGKWATVWLNNTLC